MMPWLPLFVLALLGSAYFSGSETAVIAAGRLRHRADRERGQRLAGLAERLYRRPEQTLATLLIGNNLCNVLASMAGLFLTERWLAAAGQQLGPFWSDLLSSLWVTAVVLVVGEVMPKGIGHHYAFRISRLSAPLLLLLYALLLPLVWLVSGLVWLLRQLPGLGGAGEGGARVSWETVRQHVEAGRAAGVVGADQERAIERISLLGELDAERLMRPLAALALFPIDGQVEALRALLVSRRAPGAFLYEGRPGRLLGYLSARRLLGGEPFPDLRGLMKPLLRVDGGIPALELLDSLQPDGHSLALVTDAAGEARGAVYLEDVLRELLHQREAAGWLGVPVQGEPPLPES